MSDSDKQPERAPDAIKFPTGWRPKNEPFPGVGRVDALCSYFERILGGGPQKPAIIKPLAGQQMNLVSLDRKATLLHPTGHAMEKFPRYWHYPQENGLEYLYLKGDGENDPELNNVNEVARAARSAQASADMLRMKAEAQTTNDKFYRLRELDGIDAKTPEQALERDRLHKELLETSEMYLCFVEREEHRKAMEEAKANQVRDEPRPDPEHA